MPATHRPHASVLHLDLDAFFASVEQRDKPSLRGRPVVVGGVGNRGVVSTASYEARVFGVRSAMSTREARARCPHAAYLSGRFDAYRRASAQVMAVLRDLSPLVEPLSLDEAFVDLAVVPGIDLETDALRELAEEVRGRVREVTGGLTASVGLATSKFIAKIASDLDKPDGLVVVPPGTEAELLRPMAVSVIPGVGPATAERLRRTGVRTVADLESLSLDELVRQIGKAHGRALYAFARADDTRPVVAQREAKSISVESTYDVDLTDPAVMAAIVTRQAGDVARRLAAAGHSGRTVTLKVRLADFTTLNRSATLPAPVDTAAPVARVATALLRELTRDTDLRGGVRLLGVGVAGLADWVQDDLLTMLDPDESADPDDPDEPEGERPPASATSKDPANPGADPSSASAGERESDAAAGPGEVEVPLPRPGSLWPAGADVVHAVHGRGWVWGSGRTVVTVRFETIDTPPGPVRSFPIDDPALSRWQEPGD